MSRAMPTGSEKEQGYKLAFCPHNRPPPQIAGLRQRRGTVFTQNTPPKLERRLAGTLDQQYVSNRRRRAIGPRHHSHGDAIGQHRMYGT